MAVVDIDSDSLSALVLVLQSTLARLRLSAIVSCSHKGGSEGSQRVQVMALQEHM